MADLAMLERYLVGGFAYVALDGLVVGEVTTAVGATAAFPAAIDDLPSLGCIERVAFESVTEDTVVDCPKSTGGYSRTVETDTLADYLDLQCSAANTLIHQLNWGLSAAIVRGTAQVPFTKSQRELVGWLYVRGVRRNGQALVEATLRAKITLNQKPAWERVAGRPVLRFDVQANALNTINFPADV